MAPWSRDPTRQNPPVEGPGVLRVLGWCERSGARVLSNEPGYTGEPRSKGGRMNIVTILLVIFLILGILYFARRA